MTIYVFCADEPKPYGGVKQLYRHVDILNKCGLAAYMLHERPGFRVTWFENDTPIAYIPEAPFQPSDILVAPEILGPKMLTIARELKKVVFNQNCYYTFFGHPLEKESRATPYQSGDVLGTLVVSEDSYEYLTYAFPNHRVFRIYYSIDQKIFHYHPDTKPRIAYMPRKNSADIAQVINILKYRGALDGVDLTPIDGMNETEVGAALRESLLFLSFGYPEGFSLPPAEAMACGCVTIGFHGGGAREFMKPEFSYPIAQGDIVGFARAVEEALSRYKTDPPTVTRMGREAAAFIEREYSAQREEESIARAWREIMNLASRNRLL